MVCMVCSVQQLKSGRLAKTAAVTNLSSMKQCRTIQHAGSAKIVQLVGIVLELFGTKVWFLRLVTHRVQSMPRYVSPLVPFNQLVLVAKIGISSASLRTKTAAIHPSAKSTKSTPTIVRLAATLLIATNSKLCGACATGYSLADLSGKCDVCPEPGTNTAIALLGGVCGLLGIIVYVKLTLSDGGIVEAADGIMSITLSFIQLVSLLTTFPIAWPQIFVALFQVGGSVTVLGQHLVK